MSTIKQIIDFIAKDNASTEMNKVTKASESVGKSYNVMKNVVIAAAAAIGGKAVIDAFDKQANAMSDITRAADRAGVGVDGFIKEASRLQSVTLFGDEEILKAQALGLQFDSLKGNINQITPLVLDFAQATGKDLTGAMEYLGESLALPADGMNRLEAEGIILSESTKTLTKQLQDQGDIAGAQAILMEELEKRYKGAAEAARDTMGGALKSLNNTLGDTGEIAGAVIDAFGKDFVESLIDVNTQFNNFATSTEGIKSIDNILSNLTGAFVGTKDVLIEIGSYIYDNLIDPLLDMIPAITGGADGLTVFGNTLEFIKKAMKITADAIKLFIINPFVAVVDIAKNVGNTIKAVFTGDVDGAIESAKKTMDSYGDYVKKQGETLGNLGKNTASVFKSTADTVINNMKRAADSVEGNFGNSIGKITGQTGELKGEVDNVTSALSKMGAAALKENDVIFSLFKSLKEVANEGEKGTADYLDKVNSVINESTALASAGNQLISGAFNLASQSISDELEALQNKSAEEISILEEGFVKENELRAAEFERREAEILSEPTTYAERNEKIAELEEEKANTEKEILEKQENEKKALQDKQNAALYELQLKQFKSEQAAAITNVLISSAIGIAQGFTKGVIFGSINAVAVGAMAAVQTGVIAAQAPPQKFYKGGVVKASTSGTQALIGEAGIDEMVLPMNVFENMTSGGSNGIYIENLYLTSNNVEELRAELLRIKEEDNARF